MTKFGLTKELYLERRLKGQEREVIAQAEGITIHTINYHLEKWGIRKYRDETDALNDLRRRRGLNAVVPNAKVSEEGSVRPDPSASPTRDEPQAPEPMPSATEPIENESFDGFVWVHATTSRATGDVSVNAYGIRVADSVLSPLGQVESVTMGFRPGVMAIRKSTRGENGWRLKRDKTRLGPVIGSERLSKIAESYGLKRGVALVTEWDEQSQMILCRMPGSK